MTSYPVKFVTIFSYDDEPFQYQLDTVIEEPSLKVVEHLDGIIWVDAPTTDISFTPEVSIQTGEKY